jgi:hypothetical protein
MSLQKPYDFICEIIMDFDGDILDCTVSEIKEFVENAINYDIRFYSDMLNNGGNDIYSIEWLKNSIENLERLKPEICNREIKKGISKYKDYIDSTRYQREEPRVFGYQR